MDASVEQNAADADNRTLYVTHIAKEFTEPDLRRLFEAYGTVELCKLVTQSKHSAGLLYGFVRLSTSEEANAAIQNLNGYAVGGWRMEVKIAEKTAHGKTFDSQNQRSQHRSHQPYQQQQQVEPSESLYVRGVPKTWGVDDLKSLFSFVGEVTACRILQARNTSIDLCSAIVRMATVEEAAKAIASLDQKQPPGSTHLLGVKYAEAPDDAARRKEARDKPASSARYTPYDAADRPDRASSLTSSNNTKPASTFQPFAQPMYTDQQNVQLQAPYIQQQLPMQVVGQNGLLSQLGNPYAVLSAGLQSANPLALQPGLIAGMAGMTGLAGMAGGYDPNTLQTLLQFPQLYNPNQFLNLQLPNMAQPATVENTAILSHNNGEGELSSIYVTGLPPDTDELFLYKTFAAFGGVLNVKVLTDKATHTPTGAGFVNYVNQAAAQAAQAAMDRVKVGDKELHIHLQAFRQRVPQ